MVRSIVIGLVGVVMMGCATNVDEPLPTPTAQEPQRDPPAQTLSGDLRTPLDRATEIQATIEENQIPNVGNKTVVSIPGH